MRSGACLSELKPGLARGALGLAGLTLGGLAFAGLRAGGLAFAHQRQQRFARMIDQRVADGLDAFVAHVNGSAFVRLPDGSMAKFGYAGKNGQPYTSLGHELVKDQKLDKDEFYARANDNGIGEDSLKKLELEFKKMSKDQVQQLIKQRLFEEKAISEKMQDSILTAVLEQKLKQEKEAKN